MRPDPVFEAIRRHRLAHHAFLAARHASDEVAQADMTAPDPSAHVLDLESALTAAAWDLLATPPASPGGLLALIDYAGEFVEKGYDWPAA
ncbi:hypothetical protein [Rhodoplanes sp. SY1]|uniref:hypothetical protein n=1 Tax=Rhodoplanes sp. SY1 TaxID=3166646 RepID=UPI0038B5D666